MVFVGPYQIFLLNTHLCCPKATTFHLTWWLDLQKRLSDREIFCISFGHRSNHTGILNWKVGLGTVLNRAAGKQPLSERQVTVGPCTPAVLFHCYPTKIHCAWAPLPRL